MKPCYIHSASAISSQESFYLDAIFDKVYKAEHDKWKALHPDYKTIISRGSSRRMATGVKMGIACSVQALEKAEIGIPDAIITGTGMGCIEDTETFLNAIIANNEEFLTPTSFIQSTHNTVGAQIALYLGCKGYNNTFSHASNSFSAALLDAMLMIKNDEIETVLVGGVDELGKEFVDYMANLEHMDHKGIKVPFGEGASFFVLSNNENDSKILLLDSLSFSIADPDGVHLKLNDFLQKNELGIPDIDVLLLGNNGDEFDNYYLSTSEQFCDDISVIHFKELCGEYFTAPAFGLWLGYALLMEQGLPITLLKNNRLPLPIRKILIYNQFKGEDHSFIMLSR